jgi:hypothetical protein
MQTKDNVRWLAGIHLANALRLIRPIARNANNNAAESCRLP